MSFKQAIKTFRKRLRNKLQSRIKGNLADNTVKLPHNGCVRLELKGKNNTIIFPDKINEDSHIKLNIRGDNNYIKISSQELINLNLKIGESSSYTHNSRFEIHGFACDLTATMFENNSEIHIGKGGMISWNCTMWCTDMHSVTTLDGKATNRGKSIIIGDHVWIGKDVHIAKNTNIPDNYIVGWCSNVTSKFTEKNCIIAGNPAKVVKHNVNWDRARVDDMPE